VLGVMAWKEGAAELVEHAGQANVRQNSWPYPFVVGRSFTPFGLTIMNSVIMTQVQVLIVLTVLPVMESTRACYDRIQTAECSIYSFGLLADARILYGQISADVLDVPSQVQIAVK
jgi:hypothetical protein